MLDEPARPIQDRRLADGRAPDQPVGRSGLGTRMMDLDDQVAAGRETELELGGSPFPPIAEYAFLSDCEVTALVAPSGGVEWLCLPRVDSPSIFGAMIDR